MCGFRQHKALCTADKHTTATGKQNYVAANPEADARNTAAIYEAVFGEPVQWPTEAEIEAGRQRSLDRLQQFAKRAAKEAGPEDEGGENADEQGSEASGSDEEEEQAGASAEEGEPHEEEHDEDVVGLDHDDGAIDLDSDDAPPPFKQARLKGFFASGSAASNSSWGRPLGGMAVESIEIGPAAGRHGDEVEHHKKQHAKKKNTNQEKKNKGCLLDDIESGEEVD